MLPQKSVMTIDEYIVKFPDEIQIILKKMSAIIKAAAPEAQEAISYQMPTFKFNGNLVHFAAYKNHIGFYPTPSGITEFKAELSQYKTSKGAIQFPIDKLIPYDLIRRITEFRVQQNSQK
jgi:uncharacterized protein YdhG (YjbR/CyaY superfamily)